eukprot:gnl/MRDRNA2_/MRDRNA2_43858_c0_seq1.p1 gnl/MRDRNA2_/MRDRNA2_43858_c0~~gnl/MRDRNA2_/MRDRNA2_43858_c0_seq1.p1  ORF type:complete len:101 (+),score=5.10 gnl/MRDRNA2_/MRDRNA2_43858_c0_seq1:64-366(+)
MQVLLHGGLSTTWPFLTSSRWVLEVAVISKNAIYLLVWMLLMQCSSALSSVISMWLLLPASCKPTTCRCVALIPCMWHASRKPGLHYLGAELHTISFRQR